MAELSQLPDVVDIKFVAGDTFRIRIRVIDPNTSDPVVINPGGVGDDPSDLPDEPNEYAFNAWIAPESGVHVAEFEVSADPSAPTQAVILTLPPSETAALLSLGNGFEFSGKWDLEVTFPNGDIRTVAKGSVHCYDDVTHSDPGPP